MPQDDFEFCRCVGKLVQELSSKPDHPTSLTSKPMCLSPATCKSILSEEQKLYCSQGHKRCFLFSLRNEEVIIINVGRQEMTSVNGKSYIGNHKYVLPPYCSFDFCYKTISHRSCQFTGVAISTQHRN